MVQAHPEAPIRREKPHWISGAVFFLFIDWVIGRGKFCRIASLLDGLECFPPSGLLMTGCICLCGGKDENILRVVRRFQRIRAGVFMRIFGDAIWMKESVKVLGKAVCG